MFRKRRVITIDREALDRDYDFVQNVIKSCKHPKHVSAALNLADNFMRKHRNYMLYAFLTELTKIRSKEIGVL